MWTTFADLAFHGGTTVRNHLESRHADKFHSSNSTQHTLNCILTSNRYPVGYSEEITRRIAEFVARDYHYTPTCLHSNN